MPELARMRKQFEEKMGRMNITNFGRTANGWYSNTILEWHWRGWQACESRRQELKKKKVKKPAQIADADLRKRWVTYIVKSPSWEGATPAQGPDGRFLEAWHESDYKTFAAGYLSAVGLST